MSDYSSALLEKAKKIRLLIMDVDGVLTDGRLHFSNNGDEIKVFSSVDGLGLVAIQRFGIKLAIITGRSSTVLETRAKHLGIKHLYQGQDNKVLAFNELLEQLQLNQQQVAYIGNDWNDLGVLDLVGLSASPCDAEAEVKNRVDWSSKRNGGNGAVRDLCHLIMQAQGSYQRWLTECLAGNA